MTTEIVWDVPEGVPVGKVSVPLFAVKSVPATAVPPPRVYATLTGADVGSPLGVVTVTAT